MPETSTAVLPSIDAFLQRHRRAYLFVRAADGSARGWPLTAFHAPGRLWFTTYKKSPKMTHVGAAARGMVAVLTDEGVSPVSYVVVDGALTVREMTPELVEFVMAARPDDLRRDEATEARFRRVLESGKRVVIEVALDRADHFTVPPRS